MNEYADVPAPEVNRAENILADRVRTDDKDFQPDKTTLGFFDSIRYALIQIGATIGNTVLTARIVLLIYGVKGQIQTIIQSLKGQPMTVQQFQLYITPIAGVVATILSLFHLLPGVTADNITVVLTGIWTGVTAVQSLWLTIAHLLNASHIAATPGSPTNAAQSVINPPTK